MNKEISSLYLVIILLFLATSASSQIRIPANITKGKRLLIPGEFIITLAPGVDPESIARELGAKVKHRYKNVFNGFAGTIAEIARQKLMGDKRVIRIEQDAIVTGDAIGWGQDRIDQRRLPLDGIYRKNYTGQGVTAYVIDGGIRYDHVEFGGRATFGYDVFGGNGSDCQGHGTHVAGTIGGANYGVAPGVSLVSVKVMDCNGSGTMSGVIAGMDWVYANRRTPSVVNMSLGGPSTLAMNDAVTKLINAGIVVVVAAGNSTADACSTSPANAADAITVGATNQSDAKSSFSNYGSCLDLFAPGESIISAYYTASNAYAYMSGTSMAAPHVAGAAAVELQHYPTIAPRAIRDSIYNHATKGVVTSSSSANNHLLYSLEQNDPPSAPTLTNTPPTANFTRSCTNLSCTFTDASTDANGMIASWNWNFGNGATSTLKNPSYSYPTAGTYNVSLTVTDNAGATNTNTQATTVTAPAATSMPTANFVQTCTNLSCTFSDRSTVQGGTITSWNWNFGNGATSTAQNPSYTYPAAGTYNVSLTVRDNTGTSNTKTQAVSVTAPAASAITLTAQPYKSLLGGNYVKLTWSGATSSNVDIYSNNTRIRTVSNTGSTTVSTGTYGAATFTYRVCNAGTSICSPNVTVRF